MDPCAKRQLGSTGVELPQLGFGGATLGGNRLFTEEDQALATVRAACDMQLSYFDTAPVYGLGLSEHRLGHVLRQQPRNSFVLSTKVGRLLRRPKDVDHFHQEKWKGGLSFEWDFNYTYDGIMRSYDGSQQRLGMPCIDLLLIHDLDYYVHKTEDVIQTYKKQLSDSGWKALDELRSTGQISGIGVGINELRIVPWLVEYLDIDFLLLALPYTLLNQEAIADTLPHCLEWGISVVIGAPYCYGLMAIDPDDPAQATPWEGKPELAKAQKISAVCRRHSVPLRAATLQFPLGHPAVISMIPGPNSPEQVRDNMDMMQAQIPVDLWAELKAEGLIHGSAPTP